MRPLFRHHGTRRKPRNREAPVRVPFICGHCEDGAHGTFCELGRCQCDAGPCGPPARPSWRERLAGRVSGFIDSVLADDQEVMPDGRRIGLENMGAAGRPGIQGMPPSARDPVAGNARAQAGIATPRPASRYVPRPGLGAQGEPATRSSFPRVNTGPGHTELLVSGTWTDVTRFRGDICPNCGQPGWDGTVCPLCGWGYGWQYAHPAKVTAVIPPGRRQSGTLADDSGIMDAIRVCARREVRTVWQPPEREKPRPEFEERRIEQEFAGPYDPDAFRDMQARRPRRTVWQPPDLPRPETGTGGTRHAAERGPGQPAAAALAALCLHYAGTGIPASVRYVAEILAAPLPHVKALAAA